MATDMGTAKGRIIWEPVIGEQLQLTGEKVINEDWGCKEEFKFSKVEAVVEISPRAELQYAISLTTGMGAKKAEEIWQRYGADWKDADLDSIKGLSLAAKESWEYALRLLDERRELSRAFSGLLTMGLTEAMCQKAIAILGVEAALPAIKGNPYVIAELPNYNFRHADSIAFQNGIEPNDKRRIKAAILYSINQISEGSSIVLRSSAINKTQEILGNGITHPQITECIQQLIDEDRKLVELQNWISNKKTYDDEIKIFRYFEGISCQ